MEDPQIHRLGVVFVPKTGGGSGIRTHDTVARIAVFKCVAVRTTRLHQTRYVPQSHLGCTNAFHMAARDIGYLVDVLVDGYNIRTHALGTTFGL